MDGGYKILGKAVLDDMDALNVMRADVITRVTAYVPQIATFVEKIVQKGFAYEADGSVYFDIAAFEKGGNQYAKLRPESKNDKALQEEGEGSLGKSLEGKRGLVTSRYGRNRKPESLAGRVHGVMAAQGGILSARLWRPIFWDHRWTSTQEEWIWHFRIMIMNWRRAKHIIASMVMSIHGSITSCIWGIYRFPDRKCRNH